MIFAFALAKRANLNVGNALQLPSKKKKKQQENVEEAEKEKEKNEKEKRLLQNCKMLQSTVERSAAWDRDRTKTRSDQMNSQIDRQMDGHSQRNVEAVRERER